MKSALRIVADQNLAGLEQTFSHVGSITSVDGRQLTPAQLAEADVLLVRSVTHVNGRLLAGSPVRFVGSATIGTDHLDINYLEQRGIRWANAPGCNANAVVDYVLSALCRLDGVLESLLSGARVGIVGVGNVGSRLRARLQAAGIAVSGCDPLLAERGVPDLVSLEEALSCDVVCLHTPLTSTGPNATRHLLNERSLQMLRPDAVLINAGRGAVVDNTALLQTLVRNPHLRAVLDVWEPEPAINVALLARVALATPHIAGYSALGKFNGTQMIYQAFCQMQGWPETLVSADSCERAAVSCAVNAPLAEQLRQAVLAGYDIAADDCELRAAVRGEEGVSLAFDRLRKNYPARRELSQLVIDNRAALPSLTRKVLRAWGVGDNWGSD